MAKFEVFVSCTVSRMLEIEADSEEKAKEIANKWNEQFEDVPEGMSYVHDSFAVDFIVGEG